MNGLTSGDYGALASWTLGNEVPRVPLTLGTNAASSSSSATTLEDRDRLHGITRRSALLAELDPMSAFVLHLSGRLHCLWEQIVDQICRPTDLEDGEDEGLLEDVNMMMDTSEQQQDTRFRDARRLKAWVKRCLFVFESVLDDCLGMNQQIAQFPQSYQGSGKFLSLVDGAQCKLGLGICAEVRRRIKGNTSSQAQPPSSYE